MCWCASVVRGCACPDDAPDVRACPYHAAELQKDELRLKFGDAVENEGFPFSPTNSGKTVTKDKMVASI